MMPTKPTPESGKVRIPLYLTPEAHRALRIRAIEEGTSATKLVEGLVEEFLKTKPRRTKA